MGGVSEDRPQTSPSPDAASSEPRFRSSVCLELGLSCSAAAEDGSGSDGWMDEQGMDTGEGMDGLTDCAVSSFPDFPQLLEIRDRASIVEIHIH